MTAMWKWTAAALVATTLAGASAEQAPPRTPPAPVFGLPVPVNLDPPGPTVAPSAAPARNEGRAWVVLLSDRNVRRTLERWSQQAGQQLVYDVEKDLDLAAEATFPGSYDDAVGGLMAGLQRSELPVRACLYSNLVTRIVRRNQPCD